MSSSPQRTFTTLLVVSPSIVKHGKVAEVAKSALLDADIKTSQTIEQAIRIVQSDLLDVILLDAAMALTAFDLLNVSREEKIPMVVFNGEGKSDLGPLLQQHWGKFKDLFQLRDVTHVRIGSVLATSPEALQSEDQAAIAEEDELDDKPPLRRNPDREGGLSAVGEIVPEIIARFGIGPSNVDSEEWKVQENFMEIKRKHKLRFNPIQLAEKLQEVGIRSDMVLSKFYLKLVLFFQNKKKGRTKIIAGYADRFNHFHKGDEELSRCPNKMSTAEMRAIRLYLIGKFSEVDYPEPIPLASR